MGERRDCYWIGKAVTRLDIHADDGERLSADRDWTFLLTLIDTTLSGDRLCTAQREGAKNVARHTCALLKRNPDSEAAATSSATRQGTG
jgi:hypothetical protein